MWPLSRKNNPKQFIPIKNKHSIFQETVARNMAFCDEFIIASSTDYESIIENQMKSFRGLTYRCIYEGIGKSTTMPVIMAALSLPQSEMLFVVSSDHLISGESYKDDIIRAKNLAKEGALVSFGMGMFLFNVGDFINEIRLKAPDIYEKCAKSYVKREVVGNKVYYGAEELEDIPSKSIESALFEISDKTKVIESEFEWKDVGSLDDLDHIDAICEGADQVIDNKCVNTTVVNQSEKKLVLVNHLKDVMVVNTDDAIYIGNKGDSNDLKQIIRASKSMWGYFDRSSVFYRTWGEFHLLESNPDVGYQVRKVEVLPGRTTNLQAHKNRKENLTIVSGTGRALIGGMVFTVSAGDTLTVGYNVEHQISCTSDESLVYIETDFGKELKIEDFQSEKNKAVPSAVNLGYEIEPFYKLAPSYKDYIWGGTKLRDVYGKECDYDVIAESWELSAHPDGQSIVASGRFKGMPFGEFLRTIGDENLGWKYSGGRAFPLLVKLIDAKEDLSIQVHPDDEYALEHENEYGKSELWYILSAEEGACLYVGFKEDTDKKKVKQAVADGSIMPMLNKIEVKAGESYYIPAGTVHAIGKGCLICEIQQNSNTTYRLYDYDRVDKYGNKRKLDIEKALDVIDYSKYKGNKECKYFECNMVEVKKSHNIKMSTESFCALMFVEGSGRISCNDYEMDIQKGDCIFVPKGEGVLKVKGSLKMIISKL